MTVTTTMTMIVTMAVTKVDVFTPMTITSSLDIQDVGEDNKLTFNIGWTTLWGAFGEAHEP